MECRTTIVGKENATFERSGGEKTRICGVNRDALNAASSQDRGDVPGIARLAVETQESVPGYSIE
jgi:hypothetical protein